jgi:hypothetical protein
VAISRQTGRHDGMPCLILRRVSQWQKTGLAAYSTGAWGRPPLSLTPIDRKW